MASRPKTPTESLPPSAGLAQTRACAQSQPVPRSGLQCSSLQGPPKAAEPEGGRGNPTEVWTERERGKKGQRRGEIDTGMQQAWRLARCSRPSSTPNNLSGPCPEPTVGPQCRPSIRPPSPSADRSPKPPSGRPAGWPGACRPRAPAAFPSPPLRRIAGHTRPDPGSGKWATTTPLRAGPTVHRGEADRRGPPPLRQAPARRPSLRSGLA